MLSTSAIIGSKAKVVAPSAPTGLIILDNEDGWTTASWNSVSGATKYEVRYNVNSGGWGSAIDCGTSLLHINGPWVEGTSVCVQVRVTTSGGTSDWSLQECTITWDPCGGGATCLLANTMITMANELKKIGDIKEGDFVLTYDENTKVYEPSEVIKIGMNKHTKMIKIIFVDGSELHCTPDHPWFAEDIGWVSLDVHWTQRHYTDCVINQLEVGQILKGIDDNKKIVEIIPYTQELETYQIMELSKGSTYFANGLLTKIER